MILFKTSGDLKKFLGHHRQKGSRIGFVPTMGALHQGHISLISQSKKENDLTVCSIFVNPAQFNVRSDFEKYPSMIDKDLKLLEEAHCDIVFYPSETEIYPEKTGQPPHFELGWLENTLEGEFRPGHFQGVCRVVDILLDIVEPDRLYLGQKDYQQCMVIKKLIEIKGKEKDIQVAIGSTLREPDGLAMSSRNLRLSETDRKKASTIYEVLDHIKKNLKSNNMNELRDEGIRKLTSNGFKVDYLAIVDAETLKPIDNWNDSQKLAALAAAFLGEVRLIDNLVIEGRPK